MRFPFKILVIIAFLSGCREYTYTEFLSADRNIRVTYVSAYDCDQYDTLSVRVSGLKGGVMTAAIRNIACGSSYSPGTLEMVEGSGFVLIYNPNELAVKNRSRSDNEKLAVSCIIDRQRNKVLNWLDDCDPELEEAVLSALRTVEKRLEASAPATH